MSGGKPGPAPHTPAPHAPASDTHAHTCAPTHTPVHTCLRHTRTCAHTPAHVTPHTHAHTCTPVCRLTHTRPPCHTHPVTPMCTVHTHPHTLFRHAPRSQNPPGPVKADPRRRGRPAGRSGAAAVLGRGPRGRGRRAHTACAFLRRVHRVPGVLNERTPHSPCDALCPLPI